MSLDIEFFENYDAENTPMDINNPRYVFLDKTCSDIMELIAKNRPFTYTSDDVVNKLKLSDTKLIDRLLNIEVIKCENQRLRINTPVFLESDVEYMTDISNKISNAVCQKISENKDKLYSIAEKINNGYPAKVNLYHLMCGGIFDGMFFDYLDEENVVSSGRLRKASGLRYHVIVYELSEKLDRFIKLYCSFNCFRDDNGSFESFGEGGTNRTDIYRFFRELDMNKLEDKFGRMYDLYKAADNPSVFRKSLTKKYIDIINGKDAEKIYKDFFEQFGYLKNGKICVPVYETKYSDIVIQELYDELKQIVGKEIVQALSIIQEYKNMTSNINCVDVKETANDLYHVIFGYVNKYLIESGFVCEPENIPTEGRYLKGFYVY